MATSALKWLGEGWGVAFAFFPSPPPSSETQPALWFVSCQASSGLVPPLGSGVPGPGAVTEGLLGPTPRLVHCSAPLQVQFSEILFLNLKRGQALLYLSPGG